MASEVEPMIAPRINAGNNSKSVSQSANPVITAMVSGKTDSARPIAPVTAIRKILSFRVKPHSNRMMIKVMVAKIDPTWANREEGIIPRMGPRQIPITIKKRTVNRQRKWHSFEA